MNQPPAKRMRLCSKTATVSHAPLEHPSERRERLSQALLQILTEGSTGSQGSPSSSSLVSDLRELLAEFIESTTAEISELKQRVSTLEFLHE